MHIQVAMNDARTTRLVAAVQALFDDKVETAAAPGGRLLVYPARNNRTISVRQLYLLAQEHGKTVAVRVGENGSATLIYEDAPHNSRIDDPVAVTAESAIEPFMSKCSPPLISARRLPARVAGSTDVNELGVIHGTSISAELVSQWFATPQAFDIHVAGSGVRLLSARPSQLCGSLAHLLRQGRLNGRRLAQKRTKRRRRVRRVAARQRR